MPSLYDNFASPLVAAPGAGTGTSVNISTNTEEVGEPVGSAGGALPYKSVWARTTLPSPGLELIATHGSGTGNFVVTVWEQTGAGFAGLVEIDSQVLGPNVGMIVEDLPAGDYYVQYHGVDNTVTGTHVINLQTGDYEYPAYDAFAGAVELWQLGGYQSFGFWTANETLLPYYRTYHGSTEPSEPVPAALVGAPNQATWWGKWTCPTSVLDLLSVTFNGGLFATVPRALAVYSGSSLGTLVEIDYDAPSTSPSVTIPNPTPGETYYVQVWLDPNDASDATGLFSMYVQSVLTFDAVPATSGIEVAVYEANSTWSPASFIGFLSEDFGRDIWDRQNDAGSYQVQLHAASEDVDLMLPYRLLRFYVDGEPWFSGRIGTWSQSTLAAQDESAEVLSMSGAGILATKKDAVVGPSPEAGRLQSDTRTFNWSTYQYGWYPAYAFWGPAVELFEQGDAVNSLYGTDTPEGWPDITAFWMWDRPVDLLDDPLMPVGEVYFRTEDYFDEGDYALFIAADDGFELWVDGVLIDHRTEAFQFRETRRIDLFLNEGDHCIGIKGVNIERQVSATNFAAVIFAMYSTVDGGELDTLILHSDSTWKVLGYPADPPGFLFGEIWEVLMDEAWGRDRLLLWDYDFSSTLDSAGEGFAEWIEISFRVGETYLDVLRKLAEAFVDIDVDHETSTLRVWNKDTRPNGSAVTFTTGVDIVSLQHDGEPGHSNELLVHQTNGKYQWVSAGTGSVDGENPYIEALLEAGSAPSDLAGVRVAEAQFDLRKAPVENASWEWEHATGSKPWTDVWPGKAVTLPDHLLDPTSFLVTGIQVADRAPEADGTVPARYATRATGRKIDA